MEAGAGIVLSIMRMYPNNASPGRQYLVLLAILLLCSCVKQEELGGFQRIPVATADDFYSLDVEKDGSFAAIGGYVWHRGIVAEGNAQSLVCTVDSFCNKGQFDLLRSRKNLLISVGTDGYFFSKPSGRKSWTFHRLSHWDILHHIIETPDGYLASGGKSYEKGYIFLINPSFSIDTVLYFGHEISEVIPVSKNTFLSLGWGTLQISTDKGHHWQRLELSGDFFASGHFQDSLQGIVIGYNGHTYHTRDGSLSWTKNRVAGSGFDSFRKIRNTAIHEWWITGTKGRLWHSTDNGRSWRLSQLPVKSDLYDIATLNDGRYLVCGSEGLLAIITR